jgi:hypothetical protein
VLIDDLGFGVPGAFGGPVPMPTLDGDRSRGRIVALALRDCGHPRHGHRKARL